MHCLSISILMVLTGKRRYEVFHDFDDFFLYPEPSTSYKGHSQTEIRTGLNTDTVEESLFIVAVIENKSKEVGIAAYNLKSFEIELRQFVDNNTYWTALSALCVLNPVEILVSSSSIGKGLHTAMQLNPLLVNVPTTKLDRKYFNDTQGLLYCEKLNAERDKLSEVVGREVPRYLALASCAALIKYVENIQNCSFAMGTLRIRFKDNDDSLLMDYETCKSLELLTSNTTVRGITDPQYISILKMINLCKTNMGIRYIRRNLLEPPCDYPTIITRQEALKELTQNESLFFQLQKSLIHFPDLEGIISQCIQVQKNEERDRRDNSSSEIDSGACVDLKLIKSFLLLNKSLRQVSNILEATCQGRSPLISSITESLRNPSLSILSNLISEVIEDNGSLSNKTNDKLRLEGAFAIHSGRIELLDLSRKILSETLDQIHQYSQTLQSCAGFEKACLAFSNSRGHHIKLINNELPEIEEELLRLSRNGNIFRFTTRYLNALNIRYKETLNDIIRLTNQELQFLLKKMWNGENIIALHRLCDAVGLLDCLVSFAAYITKSERHVLPKISQNGPIAIKNGRHPLLEKQISNYVPHDVFLSEASSFYLISGSNMSAHAGCFVPADFVSIRLLKRIIVRTGTNDSIEENASSFSKEMRETATILHCLEEMEDKIAKKAYKETKPTILVMIDELARATSPLEGLSIAFSVAEQLASSPAAYCLFSTHFQEMSALEDMYACVKSFHLARSTAERQEANASINDSNIPSHTLCRGFTTVQNYGIITAQEAGFPSSVIAVAQKLSTRFTQKLFIGSTNNTSFQQEQNKIFLLIQKLIVLKNAGLEKQKLKQKWMQLKSMFVDHHVASVNE